MVEQHGVKRVSDEKHAKHPTGDYCVYCLAQWPCEDAPAEEEKP